MNFLYKNRLMFWVLIVLVVVNLAALASFFLYPKSKSEPVCCNPEEQQCNAFRQELKLTDAQTLQVNEINKTYTETAKPVAVAIKETRTEILNELEKEKPDTLRLDTLTKQLSMLQMRIQKENISQYIALKRVCTTEQALKLSALYRDLYGCPMQNGNMKHRFRKGQAECQAADCN
jgi:Spy/CpxP family protein refolding chaperone